MKNTRYFSFLLMICLCLTLLPSCTLRAPSDDPSEASGKATSEYVIQHRPSEDTKLLPAANRFRVGNGTMEDPYIIYDRADLALFAEKVGSGEDGYDTACYRLANDIVYNNGEDEAYVWPYVREFSGVFDGDGHTVSGLNMDTDTDSAAFTDYPSGYGFVSSLRDGEIRNLTIKDSRLSLTGSSSTVAFIAANLSGNGIISNCTVSDSVIYANDCQNIGMICGSVRGTVTECSAAGEIHADNAETIYNDNIGGIAGLVDSIDKETTLSHFSETTSYKGVVKNCYSNVNFTVCNRLANIGGIAGTLDLAEVSDCNSNGSVSINAQFSEGMEDYEGSAGGVIGAVSAVFSHSDGYIPLINACVSHVNITGANIAGGIIGSMTSGVSADIEIHRCNAFGEISANNCAGGIIGKFWCSSVSDLKIHGCHNAAEISAKVAGGILGRSYILSSKGAVLSFEELENSGKIVSADDTAGGILGSIDAVDLSDSGLVLSQCENSGEIVGKNRVGGIAGSLRLGIAKSGNAAVDISGCVNSGSIKATNTLDTGAAGAGGIIGALDTAGNGSCHIEKCESHGKIIFEKETPSEEALQDEVNGFNRNYRIAGGIVGHIGNCSIGWLSVQTAKQDPAFINCENPTVTFTDCIFDGSFDLPSDTEYVNKAENPIFVNLQGGILGNCELSEQYSFAIRNCTANCKRLYGNPSVNDAK